MALGSPVFTFHQHASSKPNVYETERPVIAGFIYFPKLTNVTRHWVVSEMFQR